MLKETGKLIKWAFSYWKEIVSLAFVLAITFAIVYFIIFGAFAGWKYLDKKISGNYEYSLNYGLTAVVYDSKVKIKNKETGKTVGSYDKIFRPEKASQQAIVVVKNGKRGYVSAATGKVIVEPRYMRAWIADSKTGLAACVNDSSKLGFININTGETVIPFQFDYSCVYMLPHPQYYVFNNGVCPVPGKSDEDCSHAGYGLIDVTGKLLLPCEYDDINSYGDTLFKVMRDDKYGICDGKGNFILPAEFEDIADYSKSGIIAWKGGASNTALYDFNGQLLYDIWLADMEDNLNIIHDPETVFATSYYRYQANYEYCGIVDRDMNLIIPAKWERIEYLGNDLFLCSSGDISVVINNKGEYMKPKTGK